MDQKTVITTLKVGDLEPNRGQLYGLPKNPRFIRDEKFGLLKKSIEDAPEMLGLREILVYPLDSGKYVIIGGNMRYRACVDLGYKELPVKIINKGTDVAKLREYVIKDNESFGQNDWDRLVEEWDETEAREWGVEWNCRDSGPEIYDVQRQPEKGLVSGEGQEDGGEREIDPESLPEELQGVDLNPDELENIEGDDETAMERVTIAFKTGEKERLAELLGLDDLRKIVYSAEELHL